MANDFGYLVAGGLGVLVIALLLIGRYYPGSGADVLDWRPTRSLETEIELELDDVDQMLAAQNERRRRRGVSERSLDDVELGIARNLRDQHARRQVYLASLEGTEEATRDLEALVSATNRRRVRRGEAPITAEQFRASLQRDRERHGAGTSQKGQHAAAPDGPSGAGGPGASAAAEDDDAGRHRPRS